MERSRKKSHDLQRGHTRGRPGRSPRPQLWGWCGSMRKQRRPEDGHSAAWPQLPGGGNLFSAAQSQCGRGNRDLLCFLRSLKTPFLNSSPVVFPKETQNTPKCCPVCLEHSPASLEPGDSGCLLEELSVGDSPSEEHPLPGLRQVPAPPPLGSGAHREGLSEALSSCT